MSKKGLSKHHSFEERFWSRVDKSDGCWLWVGHTSRKGYARIRLNGKEMGAHRAIWIHENGPIPSGLFVLHTCDTPACVRLDHLFLGTNADNMKDKTNKGRASTRRIFTQSEVEALLFARAKGWSVDGIAGRIGSDWKTVKRALDWGEGREPVTKSMFGAA